MMRSRAASFCLVGLAFGCGGAGGGPVLWTEQLHPLSLTPGCYRAPPQADLTLAWVRVQADSIRVDDARAIACIERYQLILDRMMRAPAEPTWSLKQEAGGPGGSTAHIAVSAPSDRTAARGSFRIDLSFEGGGGGASERDPCTNSSETMQYAHGFQYPEYTEISQDGLTIVWNDSAIFMSVPTHIGDFGLFYRGCEPGSEISYGYAAHASEVPVACWTHDGAFVSCDGVKASLFE